jgi:peptide/nickel transport system ATP-binding protein
MTDTIVEAHDLARHYALPRAQPFAAQLAVRALDGVSFRVAAGASFAVVGESGSGKSTLARLVMALERPTAGALRLFGQDLLALSRAELRRARRHFQMVFQDPYGSLDPRHRVGRIVAEPLAASSETSRTTRRARVAEALESVGLRPGDAEKYPHEFSGGQRQRIAIARALITRPRLVVADEPVSALDVSVQAQVLNLLQDLQARFGITYLLISHDLAVVDYICAETAVLYRGRIVERGPTPTLLQHPAHPYTRNLLAAVPRLAPGRRRRAPTTPAPMEAPLTGCAYAPRCAHAAPRCHAEAPALRPVADRQSAACHFAERIMAAPPAAG